MQIEINRYSPLERNLCRVQGGFEKTRPGKLIGKLVAAAIAIWTPTVSMKPDRRESFGSTGLLGNGQSPFPTAGLEALPQRRLGACWQQVGIQDRLRRAWMAEPVDSDFLFCWCPRKPLSSICRFCKMPGGQAGSAQPARRHLREAPMLAALYGS